MNKRILRIALPAIATNITVPLLSLVDISIAGHLGNESYLAAISVGGTLINMLYWNFGFLRMGTSGLTAQAFGANNEKEMGNILARSLFVSFCASLLIFILKSPVQSLAYHFMGTIPEVETLANDYLSICILGAPAAMCMYSLKGWFIGMQNSFYPMIIAITINIINIACSLFFVFATNMGIKGIACGTMIAQYSGVLLALSLWWYKYKQFAPFIDNNSIFNKEKLNQFLHINGGIAIRTLCLTAVTTFFPLAGAKQGVSLLAANTLLMQLFSIFSYFTDGFAYAGEALTGRYIGAKDQTNLRKSIIYIFNWGIGLVVLFTIIYAFFSYNFLQLLTNEQNVIDVAKNYHLWVIAIPICGFSAFLWDGIMVGATMAKGMVLSIAIAAIVFFSLYNLLIDTLGNDGLWIAFLAYLSVRGIIQAIYFKAKYRTLIPA